MSHQATQRWPRRNILASLLLIAGGLPARGQGQQGDTTVTVALDPDGKVTRFEGSIRDFEAVAYLVTLREGQSLRIELATNNAANCFDIHAPAVEKPVFVGANSGNAHTLVAPKAGNYVVRVHLLRFAARDGQFAQYTLELGPTAR